MMRPIKVSALKYFLNLISEAWILLGLTCAYILVTVLLVNLVAAACLVIIEPPASSRIPADWGPPVPAGFVAPPWWAQYSREHAQLSRKWYPYVDFRVCADQAGQYINITSNCIRKTWQSKRKFDGKVLNIFVFGGSTVWGQGARDDYTIPSLLAKKLANDGYDNVKVVNFGQLAYVSTQEAIALLLELRKGNIPDLVIFYDGVNDTFSALQNGLAGNVQNEPYEFDHPYRLLISYAHNALPLSRLEELIHQLRVHSREIHDTAEEHGIEMNSQGIGFALPTDVPIDLTLKAEAILNVYFANVRLVSETASKLGFKSLFYWQPEVDTKRHLTPYEREAAILFEAAVPGYRELALEVADTYMRVPTVRPFANEAGVIDLRNIFDYEPESCFIDEHHTVERCNGIVAARMEKDAISFLENRDNIEHFKKEKGQSY
jgi:lysophospholipase L1-like esterase